MLPEGLGQGHRQKTLDRDLDRRLGTGTLTEILGQVCRQKALNRDVA